MPAQPMDPTLQPTLAKVSFAYNASLKQALTITPGTVMQCDLDDNDNIKITRAVQKGGTHRTIAGPSAMNDFQVKGMLNLTNLKNMTTYDMFIPKVFPMIHSLRCFAAGLGGILVLLVQLSTQILENL